MGLCKNLPAFQPTNTNELYRSNDVTSSDADEKYSTPTEIIYFNSAYGIDCKVDKKKQFHDENMKIAHSNTKDKTSKYPEQSFQTNYIDYFKLHLNTRNVIKSFECDICKRKFTKKSNLKYHIKSIHSNRSENEYKCADCEYKTNRIGNLKSHLSSHDDIKAFECDICKKRYRMKDRLKKHINYKHSNTSEKDYKCSKCSFQTKYESSLKLHLNTHADIKPFECDICKTRFHYKSSLRMHKKNKHLNINEKEYKCTEYSFQTNCKSSLQTHLNIHKDIKPFECHICKRRFGMKHHMKQHIKSIHLNVSGGEYKCSKCPYQTNHKGNLKIHLSTHTDIKLFECDICKKRFSQKRYMKTHMKNTHLHRKEKDYKCSECSYETNDKRYLKGHVNIHNTIKPFECNTCKKGFSHKSSLQTHIKRQHF